MLLALQINGLEDIPDGEALENPELQRLIHEASASALFNPLNSVNSFTGETASETQDVKPTRNAMCPCGSGKKYKHCHGKI